MAGVSKHETIACPVGGERFEITGTLSCTLMGYKMSLALASTCEFITRLAQCPTNRLPMYKEFTEKELVQLEIYLKTPEFTALKDKSRFYIAYKIEQFLDGTNKREEYLILLDGLWFDTATTLKDSKYMSDFRAIGSVEISKMEGKEQHYYRAMMAYFEAVTGNKEQAQRLLEKLRNEIKKDDPFLELYITSAIACASGDTPALCDPNALVPKK